MSELRSVIAFFLGLVFFIVIIGLALGRIRLPKQSQTPKTSTVQITPTPKAGLLEKIAGVFKKTTPTPKPTSGPKKQPKTQTTEIASEPETSTPVNEMKKAVSPFPQTKGGQSIPESGAPTLLIPFSLLLAGLGQKLRKQK
jgi:hypothetical protein